MSSIPPPSPGSPVPSPAYPPAAAQPRSSNKVVWIVVAAIVAVMLLVLLFVGAIIFAVFGSMKSSTPYQHAVEAATHDPRVQSALGAPVKPGWLMSGSINVAGDSGHAALTIPLEGSAHKGKLYLVASKAEGEWSYQTLAVSVDDGTGRIDPLQPAHALPEER